MTTPLKLGFAAALAAMSCGMSFAATLASDNAANSPYSSGNWTNGDNGGTGFGAWVFGGNTVSGTTAKIASSTLNGPGSIDVSGSSFQLLDSGNLVDMFRYLQGDLSVGQTFSLDMKVNFRSGWKGINVRGAGDVSLFQLEVGNGGFGDDYYVKNAATGNGSINNNGYSNNTEFNIAMTQTSAGGGSWVINRTGGVTSTTTGTYTGAVSSIDLYSGWAGGVTSPENTIF